MAWTYLAESADSVWLCRHGSGLSLTVRTTDSLNPFYFPECVQANCLLRRFGTTFDLSEANKYLSSTAYTADFHARTSALREMERAWQESEADLCLKSSGSFASADLDSHSWKTFQPSLFGGLTEYYWNSMRWGMMRDGQLFQPQKWEPRTSESESGFLPTPAASAYGSNQTESPNAKVRYSLQTMAAKNLWPTPFSEQAGGQLNPAWVEWLMGYPIEWTVCADWATPLFRKQRAKRLSVSQELKAAHDQP